MFSLAYVILPFSEMPPGDAIAASLACFKRGGRGDVPEEWLRFHDETAELQALFDERLSCSLEERLVLHHAKHSWYLEFEAVQAEMQRRGLCEWAIRLRDLEPNLDKFVARFTRNDFERHPVTGGYGYWLNGLGEWDYWELGGRFDGRITNQEALSGRKQSDISSGPSRIRDALHNIEDALCDALDQNQPVEVDVHNDNNIELVDRLLSDLHTDERHSVPGVVVLPPSVSDEKRWLKNWPHRGPAAAIADLGLPQDAEWVDVVEASYNRFGGHWAAGVAFHH